jgi:hypothetical protein
MSRWLLTLASPEFWGAAGFWLLMVGLAGEFAVIFISLRQRQLEKGLAAFFTGMVVIGVYVGHVGDDAIFQRVSERAAKAEQQLVEIKTPRTLREESKTRLLNCLRASPKGKVYIRPAVIDTDGPLLAKQLSEVFAAADFSVSDWPAGPALTWSRAGIFLIVHEITDVPVHVAGVQTCLGNAGIQAFGHSDSQHPADAVSIAIGPRL